MTLYTVILEYWSCSNEWFPMWDNPLTFKAFTTSGAVRKAMRYARTKYPSYAGDVFRSSACRVTVSDHTCVLAPKIGVEGEQHWQRHAVSKP